jgi:2-polyprenyl-6-methoxyphenol hydroxylase-like FAD-dependent oxidoreductase
MTYDAIIVGARCAGSPLAMLLARAGRKVLLLDKAAFPSDTISTHYIHNSGTARLQKWGLLDRVLATGAPPVRRLRYDLGGCVLEGAPPATDGVQVGMAPRRVVLDQILLEEALAAGVSFRESFVVSELVREGGRVTGIRGHHCGGTMVEEQAPIVVGADGVGSAIAQMMEAGEYDAHPGMTCLYYSYWSGLPMPMAELYARPRCTSIAFPTNDGLTVVVNIWPLERLDEVRTNVEEAFHRSLDELPTLGARVREGRREERFFGMIARRNFFRKAYGPGWALAGDAGYHRDPITAQGMRDAFRDADLLAGALIDGSMEALERFARRRDEESAGMYRLTMERASYAPPPAELMALLAALQDNQEQTDRFLGLDAGSVRVEEFFSPENVAAIMGRGQVAAR